MLFDQSTPASLLSCLTPIEARSPSRPQPKQLERFERLERLEPVESLALCPEKNVCAEKYVKENCLSRDQNAGINGIAAGIAAIPFVRRDILNSGREETNDKDKQVVEIRFGSPLTGSGRTELLLK